MHVETDPYTRGLQKNRILWDALVSCDQSKERCHVMGEVTPQAGGTAFILSRSCHLERMGPLTSLKQIIGVRAACGRSEAGYLLKLSITGCIPHSKLRMRKTTEYDTLVPFYLYR